MCWNMWGCFPSLTPTEIIQSSAFHISVHPYSCLLLPSQNKPNPNSNFNQNYLQKGCLKKEKRCVTKTFKLLQNIMTLNARNLNLFLKKMAGNVFISLYSLCGFLRHLRCSDERFFEKAVTHSEQAGVTLSPII